MQSLVVGGIYSAYRILQEQLSDSVCVLEATKRVGGRVYSVRNIGGKKDLTVDAGAYRFMPLEQPIITNLIENGLKLPNRLYQPGVPDYRIILTPEGQSAGFATYVEAMAHEAESMGLRISFNSRVVQLATTSTGSFTLLTESGVTYTAEKVILNIATRPLHRLLQNSIMPQAEYSPALDVAWVQRATKLYLYYPEAWWLRLGLNNGSFEETIPWAESIEVPIVARYHDGQVKCPLKNGNGMTDYFYQQANELDIQGCYGWIQMVYTGDVEDPTTNITHESVDFMSDYMGSLTTQLNGATTDVPYALVNDTTYAGAHLLQSAHTRLVQYHANLGLTVPSNALPTEAFISLWDPSITWVGGAWHDMKRDEFYTATHVQETLKPFADLQLYVADEAYSTVQGWSEGSLAMAENILRDYLGAGLPSWLPEDQWQRANFSNPAFNDYEGVVQGGGGTDAPGLIPTEAPFASPTAPAPAPAAAVATNSIAG
ncbi:hypothetical protein WJX73_010557 [Symbiochloris irregularis]|uniref:monoamine oxidase n=1 Tax=Symbiochloris irregularis TaxID=706552 RepID=A0AAW1NL28_9CHLO